MAGPAHKNLSPIGYSPPTPLLKFNKEKNRNPTKFSFKTSAFNVALKDADCTQVLFTYLFSLLSILRAGGGQDPIWFSTIFMQPSSPHTTISSQASS